MCGTQTSFFTGARSLRKLAMTKMDEGGVKKSCAALEEIKQYFKYLKCPFCGTVSISPQAKSLSTDWFFCHCEEGFFSTKQSSGKTEGLFEFEYELYMEPRLLFYTGARSLRKLAMTKMDDFTIKECWAHFKK